MARMSLFVALLGLAAGLAAAERALQQGTTVCLVPLTVVTTPQDKFALKLAASGKGSYAGINLSGSADIPTPQAGTNKNTIARPTGTINVVLNTPTCPTTNVQLAALLANKAAVAANAWLPGPAAQPTAVKDGSVSLLPAPSVRARIYQPGARFFGLRMPDTVLAFVRASNVAAWIAGSFQPTGGAVLHMHATAGTADILPFGTAISAYSMPLAGEGIPQVFLPTCTLRNADATSTTLVLDCPSIKCGGTFSDPTYGGGSGTLGAALQASAVVKTAGKVVPLNAVPNPSLAMPTDAMMSEVCAQP